MYSPVKPYPETNYWSHLIEPMATRALVTGGTGFLGSTLVRQLLEKGYQVRIFRRATSNLSLLGHAVQEVEHVVGDLQNPESLLQAMESVEVVFHTAARIGFAGRREWKALFATNVEGTAHVINAALEQGVQRLVHTSSIAALGRPEHPDAPIDEKAIWQPSRANTLYGLTKYLAEKEIYRGLAEGLDAVIVNPALIFGPGRRGENTMELVERLRRGRIPAIPAGCTCVVDVEDVAAGHLLALERGETGERYILGGENLSWREILHTLAEALQVPPPRRMLPYLPALFIGALSEAISLLTGRPPLISRETIRTSARCYRYSHHKAVKELGWSFRPFRETAQRIAAFLAETDVHA